MRLCRLSRPPLKKGGLRFPQREYHLLGRLEKLGHQVVRFDLHPLKLGNEYLSYALGILSGVLRFRKIKSDVIIADNIESAIAAILIKMVYRIPFVMDFIDDYSFIARFDGFSFRRYLIEFFEKKVPIFADIVLVVDEHKRRFCLEAGVKAEKIFLIPNGTDTKKFNPSVPPSGLPSNFQSQNHRIILYVGRLNKYYNVEIMIHAVATVFQKFPDARFVLVGDGSEKKRLEDLCNLLNIKNNVRFLGFTPADKMPGLIQYADVCLFPLPDSSALVLYEYMASGKTVIIPDYDTKKMGISHDILPEDGLLKVNNSPAAMAEAIITLLEDDNLRYQTEKNARQWIETTYDWDILASQYEKILEERFLNNISN